MATMASTCDCCHGTFAERNLLIYIYIYSIYSCISAKTASMPQMCSLLFFTITLHDAHVSYMYFQMGLPECG